MLFLTSQASNTLHLLLPFLNGKPENLSVAFIPTAADPYTNRSWMENDRNKLNELGFNVVDLDLKNKMIEEIEHTLSKADIIFVAGGNTFYLLGKIRQCGLDKVLKRLSEKNIIYIGSSAGSVVIGPNIEPMKYLDDPTQEGTLIDYFGIGLVDFIVLPHYDNPKYKNIYRELLKNYRRKYKLQPLGDNQAIVLDRDKFEIIEKQ